MRRNYNYDEIQKPHKANQNEMAKHTNYEIQSLPPIMINN